MQVRTLNLLWILQINFSPSVISPSLIPLFILRKNFDSHFLIMRYWTVGRHNLFKEIISFWSVDSCLTGVCCVSPLKARKERESQAFSPGRWGMGAGCSVCSYRSELVWCKGKRLALDGWWRCSHISHGFSQCICSRPASEEGCRSLCSPADGNRLYASLPNPSCWCQVGSLKLAVVGVFIPQTLANATNRVFFFLGS